MAMDLYRLGTTSYIIPDDILPNVNYLAGKVRDVELVLFEVDDGPNNLPGPDIVAALAEKARAHDLSYTVHLPLDLQLGEDGSEQHVSLQKARKVIETTRDLNPWAYVLHLDGREIKDRLTPALHAAWTSRAARALELVGEWAGGPQRLAVENLEGYPLDFWEGVFARVPAGRCVDIGHLWRDGHDPLPYLEQALARTRVLHIHGIGTRDHQSLAHVAVDELARVLGWLRAHDYSGVLTVEVFGEEDFLSSLEALRAARLKLGEA